MKIKLLLTILLFSCNEQKENVYEIRQNIRFNERTPIDSLVNIITCVWKDYSLIYSTYTEKIKADSIDIICSLEHKKAEYIIKLSNHK